MGRLTIALVSDWFAPRIGGIELHLQELALQLQARGHDVQVVTTTPGDPTFLGIPVHRKTVPMVRGWDVAVPNLLRIPITVRALREIGPDIVHAHGMFSTVAISSLIAARHLRIPCISTHHSMLPGGHLWGARAVFALFSYRADVVSAVSRAAATDARRASGRRHVPVLPNGIHPGAWLRSQVDTDDVCMVSVMRLTPTKSPHVLVKAFAGMLPRVAPARRVHLTIVGDGPQRSNLESMARELSVADRITFAGEVPRDRVRTMLARGNVFVLPGEVEAFGIAALEARCAGLPVVAMNKGGIPEIIEHGRHGLLADTPAEFEDHLVRITKDDALRCRLAAAAALGVERFAWDRVIEAHLRLYGETVDRHRARTRQRSVQ